MNMVRGRVASRTISPRRRSRPYLTVLALLCGALSPETAFAVDTTETAPVTVTSVDTACSGVVDLQFWNVRHVGDINCGPDLAGTGRTAINFTGPAGSAGDAWITVLDAGPFSSDFIFLQADVLIHRFNNRKGAGLLALFNDAPADKGLALILYDNGNTDSLVLAIVGSTGQLTQLKSVPLGAGILNNVWYRVEMTVHGTGVDVNVVGDVFRHTDPSDPDSLVDPERGHVGSTLTFNGSLLPLGLQPIGQIGVIASAVSAVVDSSVTNLEVAIP